ncbi:TPA: hypothetical protein ACH3X1_004983 [Trebouxia sp. C0004]
MWKLSHYMKLMLVATLGIAQMAIMRKTLSQLPAGHCHHCHSQLQTMQPHPPRDQETCKGRSREGPEHRRKEFMKRVQGIHQLLQDMKRAIGVTFLVSVAAELPHTWTRPGTE